jgi:hypothetical protein
MLVWVCLSIIAGCLGIIQLRHFGWRISWLDEEFWMKFKTPLDSTNKKLALMASIAFLLCMALILTGNY